MSVETPQGAPAVAEAATAGAPPRPPSAVPDHTGFAGVAGFALAAWLAIRFQLSPLIQAIVIAAGTVVPMIAIEWRRTRIEDARAPVTIDPPVEHGIAGYALRRVLGMIVTSAPFVVFYLLVVRVTPASQGAMLVAIGYSALAVIAVAVSALTTPAAERRADPGYRLGAWLLREAKVTGDEAVQDHFRTWALKLFFVPFLASVLPGNAQALDASVRSYAIEPGWVPFVFLCHNLFYLLDVTVGLLGYLVTVRSLGSHIRSTNPYRDAWLYCLICYPPFWPPVRETLLAYDSAGIRWDTYLGDGALIYVWGTLLIVLEAVYVWATVVFGLRFSNLTHRGILSTGPYRFLKHPAYTTKNISWWLWSLPFVPARGVEAALVDCLQLAAVNWIYWMRAKTEERHLRADPAYRDYEAWIASRSLLRRLRLRGRRPG